MTAYETLVCILRRRVKVEDQREQLCKKVDFTRASWFLCTAVLLLSTAGILIATRGSTQGVALVHDRQLFGPLVWDPANGHLNHSSSSFADDSKRSWHNVYVNESASATYLSTILTTIKKNKAARCNNGSTASVKMEGPPTPNSDGRLALNTGELHRLVIIAFDEQGQRRCAGGDYFEVDFHDHESAKLRSRLPTVDFGNGSYGLDLLVPSRFLGAFKVDIWLLFSNWHGLDRKTEFWAQTKLMLSQDIDLVSDCKDNQTATLNQNQEAHCGISHNPDGLKKCSPSDFYRSTWQGRWTRTWFNKSCTADSEKRFRCLDEAHSECKEPWCYGPLSKLESNGWHYSAHCGFKIFQREEAWKCLNGRWFLMWGDSNFQDTIRNLFLFVLDWELPRGQNLSTFQLERSHDTAIFNVQHPDQMLRVTQHFNGANYPWKYGAGLRTLRYEIHRQQLLRYFNGSRWPDTVVMNSGLHDGDQFNTIADYASSADFAISWWTQLYQSIPEGRRPQLIWRSTVAPAGFARRMNGNPNKMEVYNQIMAEKLQQHQDKLPVQIIDGFDMTFPFHYNNDYSDGGHYGRAPGYTLGPWHNGTPHWYFVDVMLAHILLNVACPSESTNMAM